MRGEALLPEMFPGTAAALIVGEDRHLLQCEKLWKIRSRQRNPVEVSVTTS